MRVNKLMLLVGDIGATKTDLAIYSSESDANSLGELHGLLRRGGAALHKKYIVGAHRAPLQLRTPSCRGGL